MSDEAKPSDSAIQAKIDETLKLCDAATFRGEIKKAGEFLERLEARRVFDAHARKMLSLYARALKEACMRARLNIKFTSRDASTAAEALAIFDGEIVRLLNGKSEGSDGVVKSNG